RRPGWTVPFRVAIDPSFARLRLLLQLARFARVLDPVRLGASRLATLMLGGFLDAGDIAPLPEKDADAEIAGVVRPPACGHEQDGRQVAVRGEAVSRPQDEVEEDNGASCGT